MSPNSGKRPSAFQQVSKDKIRNASKERTYVNRCPQAARNSRAN